MDIGIIGMFLAIIVMIAGAYMGVKAIPLTLIAALVVILFNQMGVWPGYVIYATRFGQIISSFFFIFVASSVYAMVMQSTGSTVAIGQQLIKWFGLKHVLWVIWAFCLVLTYGGVLLFVCVFAVVPVAFYLFKEAKLPRHLLMAPLAAGGATITMTTLPGTPALTNVIPSRFLGTPLTSAPVFSLVFAAGIVALTAVYFKWAVNDARKKNEDFEYPAGFDPAALNFDKSKLPPSAFAFLPIITLILFIIISSVAGAPWANDGIQLTSLALVVATALCLLLNYKRINFTGVKNWLGTGADNGIIAMIGLAAVIAFGAVVSAAPTFQGVIQWIIELDMNVYVKGVVSTGIISGITGSSSGGAEIALSNLADYFINSGANLELLHRLIAIGAGTLDTLPHVGAIFLLLQVVGCTHKEAYKHMWWTTVVIPTGLLVIVLVPIVLIF